MLEGVDNYDGDIVLITHTPRLGLSLARGRKNIKVVSLSSLNHQLRGLRLPVAIDNSAILAILTEALHLIDLEKTRANVLTARLEYTQYRLEAANRLVDRATEATREVKSRWYVRLATWIGGLYGH